MDIQDELREAWDEVIPADEDRQSDVFVGGINDRDKMHFALGYLSAKRRLGVSKPDRRAELLELAGFMAPIGAEMAKRFNPEQVADGFASVLSKALAVLTKQD